MVYNFCTRKVKALNDQSVYTLLSIFYDIIMINVIYFAIY